MALIYLLRNTEAFRILPQYFIIYINLEGVVGFEPTLIELQSIALPLGYTPIRKQIFVSPR